MNKQSEQINAQELQQILEDSSIKVVPIDVRTEAEYKRYHIKGSLNIPIAGLSIDGLRSALELNANDKIIIVTYCNAGGRGGIAFNILKASNTYDNIVVKNLQHGINEWIDAGYAVEENN